MQTKEQFLAKVEELLAGVNEMVMEKAKKVYESGAFDPEDYEDNFLLPKIFVSAMGEEIKFQYKPLEKKSLAVRNNLAHFI